MCTLQYVGCHSYQNANLTASLLQTTFTHKKELLYLPFIPPSTHLPVHLFCLKMELSLTQHSLCLCVRLCVCVCTLYVCTLPWLRAGLTGVITSKPPSQRAKRRRKELKAAPLCSAPAHTYRYTHTHFLLVWSHIPLSSPHSFNRVQWHRRRGGEMVERKGELYFMHTDSNRISTLNVFLRVSALSGLNHPCL